MTKQNKAEKSTAQKAKIALNHIRMTTYFKLCVLEKQCSIPEGHLGKQLRGIDIMQPKHYESLYSHLLKTRFEG